MKIFTKIIITDCAFLVIGAVLMDFNYYWTGGTMLSMGCLGVFLASLLVEEIERSQ